MGGSERVDGIFYGRVNGFCGSIADHRVRIGRQMAGGENKDALPSAWTQAQYKLLRIIAPKEPAFMAAPQMDTRMDHSDRAGKITEIGPP